MKEQNDYIGGFDPAELRQIVGDVVSAAKLAATAGFRLVQIHAAHGYFLSSFLSHTLNPRVDEYSANGLGLLGQIIESVADIGDQVALDIRLSATEGFLSREAELRLRTNQIREIVERGVDMVSLSDGFYDISRARIYPHVEATHLRNFASQLAATYPHIAWNVAGGLRDINELENDPTPNLSFSLGRPLIANPRYVQESLFSDPPVASCRKTGRCHYFSRGTASLVCGSNGTVSEDGSAS